MLKLKLFARLVFQKRTPSKRSLSKSDNAIPWCRHSLKNKSGFILGKNSLSPFLTSILTLHVGKHCL